MHQAIIRRAGPEDAELLAELGAATFAETFGHLYPPEDLAVFLEENHTRPSAAQTLADPQQSVWLALVGDQAVGFVQAGPCTIPVPAATAGCLELKRLYVLRPWQGGGLGVRLFETALAWLEARSPRGVCLGVWSENHGAQRFYARFGFAKVGEYEFEVGATRDLEFILYRPPRA